MKRKRGGIVSQLLMILLVVVIIFPLYFMTANSFKTHEEYVNNMAANIYSTKLCGSFPGKTVRTMVYE